MKIDVDKIKDVIGSGGKTIKKIIELTGVEIDVEETGVVHILSVDADAAARAHNACRARAASALEQQRRMALLQTKQEIIGQMLQSALHTLQAEPADAYFAAVEKLVERFARPQAGQIVFSQQDLDRMPENFAARLNAIAQEKGGALTLAPAGQVVGGGFILVYGGIQENCTFPALFEARKEELQDLVHKQLFA